MSYEPNQDLQFRVLTNNFMSEDDVLVYVYGPTGTEIATGTAYAIDSIGDKVWEYVLNSALTTTVGRYSCLFAQSDNYALDNLEVQSASGGATAAQVWAYATRTLTQSAAAVTAAVSGSDITILRGDTVVIALTGLGNISTRAKLWFSIKDLPKSQADTAAIIEVEETGGLLRLNGTATTASYATLVVTDATAGNITVTLKPAATAQLSIQDNLSYDVQTMTAAGVVTTLTLGVADITEDVTRAIV